jgi:uncharacterized protein
MRDSMIMILCSVADCIALGLGAWLAWRTPPDTLAQELGRFLAAGIVVVAAFFVLTTPFGGFGVMRGLAHALFCVLLPLYCVRGLRIWRERAWLAALLIAAFALGEGIYLVAREVEPFRLEVTAAEIHSPKLADLGQPLRIAVVADLQTDSIGAFEMAVFDELVRQQPDLVLFLGDYLQMAPGPQFEAELSKLRTQLRRLTPRHGAFAVDGDVDGAVGGAERVFEGTGVQVMNDRSVELSGVPIALHGLSRARSRAPFVDAGLVRRLGQERFPLVFGHAPDFMLSVLRDGYALDGVMLAGHTHGGQVQIPGFGPLVTLSAVPRWLAGGGVFQRGPTWLAQSRGLGMERGDAPRLRLFCRPQLLLLTLRAP